MTPDERVAAEHRAAFEARRIRRRACCWIAQNCSDNPFDASLHGADGHAVGREVQRMCDAMREAGAVTDGDGDGPVAAGNGPPLNERGSKP